METNSKKSLAEKIAFKLAIKIKNQNKTNYLHFVKMKYGLEILIINLSKLFLIFVTASILGMMKETLIIMISFAFVRRYAFGVHSQNSINCTIITASFFFGGGYISKFLVTTNYDVVLTFFCVMILLYLYAPADTEERPLIGKKNRRKLKMKSLLSASILMLLAICIGESTLKFFICYGALCESIIITPIIYKMFRRRYKNYEYYKKVVN